MTYLNAVLVLLDLSSAFDTVDHSILLNRLEEWVGIKGTALLWFKSYLQHRTFSVSIGHSSSPSAPVSYGVPQGSILGPILFCLYMLPLGDIIRKHFVSFHFYADDTQLYLPLTSQESSQSLLDCVEDIKRWMSNNFLQLNDSKTEVVIFAPPNSIPKVSDSLSHLSTFVKPSAKSLGVIFEPKLCFKKQINNVIKNSYFQLRVIAQLKPSLSFKDLETVIHAFITSRLDYCNALYYGLPQNQLARLQLVQNAAARLLTGTKRQEHITPVLSSLHWLPICFRIQFKMLLLVFKSFHGHAPTYISNMLQHYSTSKSLRSADKSLLHVPRSRLKHKGDRAFAVAAPRLWNSLPPDIKSASTTKTFKCKLKTYLYTLAFPS